MSVRKTLLQTTMLAGFLGGVYPANTVRAADLVPLTKEPPSSAWAAGPAVDGVNGKVDGFGGSLANRSIYGSKGALSIPLDGQWGLQIDGAVGSLDQRAFGSIAGHLFWRNPSQALFGLYVGHTRWDQFGGMYVTQVAGEGEAYWGRWTLQGIAGVEFGNSASNTTTTATIVPFPGLTTTTTFTETFDVRTRFFDQINLKYYFTDNFDGYVGHRYLGGENALALGTEVALPLQRGLMGSAFVEARVGEGQFHGVWGGLKFYFGQKDKPLIARHRQDDPNNWSVDTLFSIINSAGSSGSANSCVSSLTKPGSCEAGGGT